MNSNSPFWSKGSNRAVVYGIGLLILFGSYVIEGPDSESADRNRIKTKLSASVKKSTLEEIKPVEQEEQLPVIPITSSSVIIDASKKNLKSTVTNIVAQNEALSVPEFTADEICDELAGVDALSGRYINIFIAALDSDQNIKTKEFVNYPISTEGTLAKIFSAVQKPEGLEQKWEAYKLCNTNKCVTGNTSVARGDWLMIPSMDKQPITSGEVYAIMYPTTKLPIVDCVARAE